MYSRVSPPTVMSKRPLAGAEAELQPALPPELGPGLVDVSVSVSSVLVEGLDVLEVGCVVVAGSTGAEELVGMGDVGLTSPPPGPVFEAEVVGAVVLVVGATLLVVTDVVSVVVPEVGATEVVDAVGLGAPSVDSLPQANAINGAARSATCLLTESRAEAFRVRHFEVVRCEVF